MSKHKVFISYHHENDQYYKNELLRMNRQYQIFIDGSVNLGDINDNLSSEQIRSKIRDLHLKDTTVTILLVGTETKGRKHVDWEIYSSMYDGRINKKSGILIINLPTIHQWRRASGDNEKQIVYPGGSWKSLTTRQEYERSYPYLSDRIIDNFLADVPIAVVDWNTIIGNPFALKRLIDNAHSRRTLNNYDSSRQMRRNNAKRLYS